MSDLQHARIGELCAELRLTAMPDLDGAVAQAAVARDASYSDFLEEALRAERDARRVRAREMFARTAGFPTVKTLDGYDFGFASGAPRQQLSEFASLAFVERGRERRVPRPLRGRQDAPGHRARLPSAQRGWKVRFTSAADLVLTLETAQR